MSFSGIYLNTSGSGPGAVVQTLTSNSGGAVPPTAGNINIIGGNGINIVGTPGSSTLIVSSSGNTFLAYTNVNTTPYVVLLTDEYLSIDTSALAITIQLPNAPTTGQVWIIKDRTGNAQTNNIIVTTVGGAVNIDGATTFVMNTQYEAIQILWNGTTYEVY